MKKPKPTKHDPVVFNQLCKLIPVGMVSKLASEYGVEKMSRTFSPWSHVVCLLYCQLTHCIGLNDLCDALRHHSAKLFAIRGATAPSRNGLSHANKSRNADMMEALFWKMLDHLQNQFTGFGSSGRYKGLPRRFKKTVYSIDSSTIALVANCMDWAKHRRRKAAAKLHLCLNLQTFLPSFAVIEEGAHHDNTRMVALCARLVAGEIAVFDKAYVHFQHLFSLTLQVCDFLGHTKQAIRWQLWSALLMYLLLRFQAWSSDWSHSFARIFTMIRGIVWDRFDLSDILNFYGTAGGRWRMSSQPQTAYLPNIAWQNYGIADA